MVDNKLQSPKVVLIGAGSLFFGRKAIWQMCKSEYLNKGTLALVDIDETTLEKMTKLAKMVVEETGVELKIESSTNRKDVLPGADFVVLSFAKDSIKYRGIDCQTSAKYGVRMCSGDTIGPGGIFRAMRELPHIFDCAKEVEELCPDAWIINYINPTAVNGIGLSKYAPNVKSFALCDTLHMPYVKKNYMKRAGIISCDEQYYKDIADRFDFRISGVNHFTFALKAEFDGKDVAPMIAESIRQSAITETNGGDVGAKARFNDTMGYELYKVFGYVPVCVGHTKEYVRFWQGRNVSKDPIEPLYLWETEKRYQRTREMFDEVDSFLTGKTPISEYMKMYEPDHATDIIENMVGNLGKPFYINTTNRGALTNMTDDAFMELLCDVTLENGAVPRPVGKMPTVLKGMQELVLATHELTAEAIFKGDISLIRKALLIDPLTCSITDADNIMKELLELEKEQLSSVFYN